MQRTLKKIFEEAKQDEFSAVLDGKNFEARLLYGIRIEKRFRNSEHYYTQHNNRRRFLQGDNTRTIRNFS